MNDLFAALKQVAESVPASIASFSRAGYLTHQTFYRNIDAAARHAISQGVRPGQLVVVRCSHQDARLQLILALMRIGCRVGVSHNLDTYRAHELPIDVLITDDAKVSGPKRILPLGPEWFKPNAYIGLPERPGFSVLFNSSGSTGAGKIMEISEAGFLYRLNNRFNDLHHGERPRFLCFGGEGTSNSIQDCIVVLLKGGMIMRPIDGSAQGVLEALQLHHPNYMFATPAMIANWIAMLAERPAQIEKVDVLRIGGAFCSAETRAAALKHFAHSLVMSFGSTETGNIAARTYTDAAQTDSVAGKVRGDVEVVAVDAQGVALPPGTDGHLRIKVPAGVMASYVGKSQSPVKSIEDGWFITGDIGRIDADRSLSIAGRASQIINAGGTMINPEAIEEAAALYAGIKEIGVVGVEGAEGFQRIHAAVVTAGQVDVGRLNAFLHQRHHHFILAAVHSVERIPKTEAGKVDRPALRNLIASRAT